jgi:hypothetical protein
VQPVTVLPLRVTAPFAKTLPAILVPVRVMSAPAIRVPWNVEVVSVTACSAHQVALHGLLPLTVRLVAVRAPAPLATIKKVHGPEPRRVTVPVFASAVKHRV